MAGPIIDRFSRIAPTYDRVNRLMTLGLDRRWRRRLIDALPASAPGGRPLRILDLCAGTLACTIEALRRFPDAAITAVDGSAPMLERGVQKVAPAMRGRIDLRAADVLDVDLPAASFDAVLCAWGVRNVPAIDALLDRLRGWLAPGGCFLTLDLFRPASSFARLLFQGIFCGPVPIVGGWISGDREAYRYLTASIRDFDTIAEYEARLRRHGFAVWPAQRLGGGLLAIVAAARDASRDSR